MKTYSLSRQEIDYLQPVDAVLQALNAAIQNYVVGRVYPRLGVPTKSVSKYLLTEGTLLVLEEGETDFNQKAQVKTDAQPESKPVPTPEPTKAP